MERVITGAAADWLAWRRAELNERFARARKRFATLSADAVLTTLADVLPALAGPEPASNDLLSAAYDLVLLQVGRNAFASHPGLDRLVRRVFPAIRPLLLQRPSTLPAALVNAVENMGARGETFAETIGQLAAHVDTSDLLLDVGAVVAWRLGEARLRPSALVIAARLPARLLLAALGVEDWPDEAGTVALAGLRADGWRGLRQLLSDDTLRALRGASPQQIDALTRQVTDAIVPPDAAWQLVATVGDFAGFGGHFDRPPVVLDGGHRHQFFARCGPRLYRIDADTFGWACRHHPDLELSQRSVNTPARSRRGTTRSAASPDEATLLSDGVLTAFGVTTRLPALAGATAYVVMPELVAATTADSHRIRIAVRRRELL